MDSIQPTDEKVVDARHRTWPSDSIKHCLWQDDDGKEYIVTLLPVPGDAFRVHKIETVADPVELPNKPR